MSFEDRELAELLRSTVDSDSASEVDFGTLDFGTLLKLKAGELEGEAADEARRALIADPELARALLDVDRLDELEQAAAGVGADRQEAAWERLVAAGLPMPSAEPKGETAGRALASVASEPREEAEETARSWTFRRLVARYPVAAMAASMVLASALTILLTQPGAPGSDHNSVVDDSISDDRISGLFEYESLSLDAAAGPQRSAGARAQALVLSQGASSAVLVGLNPPARLALGFDLPDVAEAVLFQGDSPSEPVPTRLQEEGMYLLWIPARELTPGLLRIELRDPTGGETFAEYSLDLLFDESLPDQSP